jgi:peptidoglycan/LPS O-acetylase OafA/YrhL
VIGIALTGQIAWIAIGMALAVISVAAQEGRVRWLRALGDRSELCWAGAALAFAGVTALLPGGGLFGLIAALQTVQPVSSALAKLVLEAAFVAMLLLPAVFGDRRGDLPRRLLAWRPVVWLGVISYSFYLWHLTVLEFIARSHLPMAFSGEGLDLLAHVHFAPTLALYVIGLLVSGILASITYSVIELPFLRRKEPSYPRAR